MSLALPMSRVALVALLLAAPISRTLTAADPAEPVYWSAEASAAIDKKLDTAIDPARHLAAERLLDSALVIHRDGNSEGEIHTELADFIVVRAGEGVIVVGGRLVDAKDTAPGEKRGPSIEGGKRFAMKAGDQLYVPANTPHQFQVERGKKFTATIVKITPKK